MKNQFVILSAAKNLCRALFLLAAQAAVGPAKAANDYNIRLFANVTGDVEQVVLDPSQFSLTLTNFPNGVRRGSLEFIGSSGGGGTQTVLVAEPGVLLTPLGTGTNGIGADFSIVVSNQMTGVQLNGGPVVSTGDTTDFYPRASNPAGYLTSIGGFTNGNVVAPGYMINITPGNANTSTVSAVSATVNSLSNNTYTTGTTQSMDVATANVGTFTRGAIAGWNTNKSGFAVIVVRGTDGSDAYNVDGTQVALVASNNTFTATNNFTAPVFIKGSTVISNSPSIIGNLNVTGTVTAANLLGALNGTNLTGIGSVATNLLARFSNNSGTIGGAGNYLVVTFDPNTGLPIGWTTVQGLPAGASTNAVTFLENANNGNTYNNVNGIIFTNVPYFTQNQSTNTVGFSNVVFDTVQLVQGGTNFVLHGATLSVTNANTQGLAFSLTNGGTLTVSGTISNLTSSSTNGVTLNLANATIGNTSTLTIQTFGQYDTYFNITSNNTGDAFIIGGLQGGGTAAWSFKHDATILANELRMFMNLGSYYLGVIDVFAQQGSDPGISYDFKEPHKSTMFNAGAANTAGAGYDPISAAAPFVFDQHNDVIIDNHSWYFGNDTNFFSIYIKADGQDATSATGRVQNSDWTGLFAASATNGLPKMGGLMVASNYDFCVVLFSTGMSTNDGNNGYSFAASDAHQWPTQSFAGWLSGRNGTFGAALTNLISILHRDETNGLQVVTVSTNFGGSIYLGPTNNLYQTLLAGGPSMTLPVNGSTLYVTNGQLVGTSTP